MTLSANTTNLTNTSTTPGADDRHRRIVVGYDGSSSARSALRRGISLAPRLETDLVVVASWHFPTDVSAFGYGDWSPEADAQSMLGDVIAEEFPSGSPSWFSALVLEGRPAEVLLAQSRGAEMLIVGSRGHGGFAGLLLGSVSSACAEHAECPVLVMHGDRAQEEPDATRVSLAAALA